MRVFRLIGLLPLILALAPPLHAQWRNAPRFEALDSGLQIGSAALQRQALDPILDQEPTGKSAPGFIGTFASASAGSLIGLALGAGVGVAYYQATGCCGGGDDPGLTSLLVGALVGSTSGSAAGAAIVGEPWGGALIGSTAGVATGLAIAYAGRKSPVAWLMYSLTQGLTTAAITTLIR